MKNKTILATSLIIAGALNIALAHATPDNTKTLSQYYACQSIEDDAQRLSCFDAVTRGAKLSLENSESKQTRIAASQVVTNTVVTSPIVSTVPPSPANPAVLVAKLQATNPPKAQKPSAISTNTPAVVTPEPLQQALSTPTTNDFGFENRPDPTRSDKINAVVNNIVLGPRKKRTFTLDNGQVWREVEVNRLRVKNDQQVFIERGALGSFRLGTQNATRMTRVKRVK